MIPKPIRDAVEERRRLREHCAICEEPLDRRPCIFYEGSGDDVRQAHVECVDWTVRESPGRDLVKRIRSTRRRLGELDRVLALAENVAHRINDGWPRHATKRAVRYFELVDQIRAAIYDATGGW